MLFIYVLMYIKLYYSYRYKNLPAQIYKYLYIMIEALQ